MGTAHLIFPNQLFKNIAFVHKKAEHIYVVEDPFYFYDARERPFHVHKLKIAYMRATMKLYTDVLSKDGFNVSYIDYDETPRFYKLLIKFDHVSMLNPHDFKLIKRYNSLCSKLVINTENDESFLIPQSDILRFKARFKGKNVSHATFYKFVKSKLDVLVGQKSTDLDNRHNLDRKGLMVLDHIKQAKPYHTSKLSPYYDEAVKYVESHKVFSKHHGSLEMLDYLPLTHMQAKEHLESFLKNRFSNYGAYQDATHIDQHVLFHSHCSFLINNGLLTPKQVVDEAMKYKRKVPMNSFEGFLRQLIGWREYMRFIYAAYYDELLHHFEPSSGKLSIAWYNGTTGIEPIDNEIKKVIKHAWSHHIIRLMYFLNIMKLLEVPVNMIYKWFFEMISLDAYEWVMMSNIAAMGMYDTRFMSKPYISSSSYILRMSNYKKGSWFDIWNALFYSYLVRHKSKLVGKYSIYNRNLSWFMSLSSQVRKNVMATARKYKNTMCITCE